MGRGWEGLHRLGLLRKIGYVSALSQWAIAAVQDKSHVEFNMTSFSGCKEYVSHLSLVCNVLIVDG